MLQLRKFYFDIQESISNLEAEEELRKQEDAVSIDILFILYVSLHVIFYGFTI